MTTAKQTKAELDFTNEKLIGLESHAADTIEASQRNMIEGAVALEALTGQIAVLREEMDTSDPLPTAVATE